MLPKRPRVECSPDEAKLRERFAETLFAVTEDGRAIEMGRTLFNETLSESRDSGLHDLGPDLYNIIKGTSPIPVGLESILVEITESVRIAQEEGARTEDIAWWWSHTELERRLIAKLDEKLYARYFAENLRAKLTPDEAALAIHRTIPIYVYSLTSVKNQIAEAHRPIAAELKNRVDKYLNGLSLEQRNQIRDEAITRGSLNCILIDRIKAGQF